MKLNVSTASRQIATLEAKGFIKRFPDRKNGRTTLVEITDAGKEVYQRVKRARKDVYAQILRDWSGEELERLQTSLSDLNEALIKRDK